MKFQRQAKILDLIDKHEIETQEELSEQLRNVGYNTTQATVSRDIKELRLIKILSSETGKYKYAVASSEVEGNFTTRLRNIFKECVISVKNALNLAVIKTIKGMGGSDASFIDKLNLIDLMGTTFGDDTVLLIFPSTAKSSEAVVALNNILV